MNTGFSADRIVTMVYLRILAMIVLAAALPVPACAAAVQRLTVDQPGPYYRVVARIHLRAKQNVAFEAATKFGQIAARSPMIKSTRRIDNHKLESRIRLCVMWYCQTVEQIMRYCLDRPNKRLTMRASVSATADTADPS